MLIGTDIVFTSYVCGNAVLLLWVWHHREVLFQDGVTSDGKLFVQRNCINHAVDVFNMHWTFFLSFFFFLLLLLFFFLRKHIS
jgi:hypothetical protein